MDKETLDRMKHMVDLLDTIWGAMNSWYENKNLLELP